MPSSGTINAALGERVREIREELFGEGDATSLADALHLPERHLEELRGGRGPPRRGRPSIHRSLRASIPHWLLSGRGRKYSRPRLGHRRRCGSGAGAGAMPCEAVTMLGEVIMMGMPGLRSDGDPPAGTWLSGARGWAMTERLRRPAGAGGWRRGLGLDRHPHGPRGRPRGTILEAWFRERHRSIEYSLILGASSRTRPDCPAECKRQVRQLLRGDRGGRRGRRPRCGPPRRSRRS